MPDYSNHLAVQANLKSVQAAVTKDRETWLGLFDENAVVSDPVGVSPFDNDGMGHIGKAKITAFYDNVIANADLKMEIGEHRVAGAYACAVPMKAINKMAEGPTTNVDMITVYHVNPQGLIVSLHAYWDWGALEEQVMAAFASGE